MRRPWLMDYIGKPFVDGGRGPAAYDCWGLVLAVYRDVYDIALPDFDIAASALQAIAARIRHEQDASRWTRLLRPEEPSVVAMAIHPDHPRLANHCGVYIGANRVLHVVREARTSTFKVSSPMWRGRIVGFYRWTNPNN